MRDPNRIDPLLETIRTIWKKYPVLRLGQLIHIATVGLGETHRLDDCLLERQLKSVYPECFPKSTPQKSEAEKVAKALFKVYDDAHKEASNILYSFDPGRVVEEYNGKPKPKQPPPLSFRPALIFREDRELTGPQLPTALWTVIGDFLDGVDHQLFWVLRGGMKKPASADVMEWAWEYNDYTGTLTFSVLFWYRSTTLGDQLVNVTAEGPQ